jgi:hypothetical protein
MKIIEYFNENKFLPDVVDSSEQFQMLKSRPGDLTHFFFEKETKENLTELNGCEFHPDIQFLKYDTLNLLEIRKFISIYFEPTDFIKSLVTNLETKYNLDYENLCSVFYRGNDKSKETNLASYESFFEKVDQVISKNPNVKLLVQTDELEFRNEFSKKYKDFIQFDEIPVIPKSMTFVTGALPVEHRQLATAQFLAATIVVSKCKWLVSHSGNCGIWAFFFRGGVENTYQYLDHQADFINHKGWIIN